MKDVVTLKVAGTTNVKSLAGSISFILKGDESTPPKNVELLAIGASSVAQGIKAVAISSGHMATWGGTVKMRVGFKVVQIEGQERTVMRMLVECE